MSEMKPRKMTPRTELPAEANESAMADRAASRSPLAMISLTPGVCRVAACAITVNEMVTSMVTPQKSRSASKVTQRRQPRHFFISSGFSVSNMKPRAGMASSSPAWRRPRICGMCAPMPAPESRRCRVYHICCIPDGPANAIDPTITGNHAAVIALVGDVADGEHAGDGADDVVPGPRPSRRRWPCR